jgi:hypothetical protein
MSANLATSSWTTGGAGVLLAEPANDRGAHTYEALDLGLHGRGHHTGEYLRVNGGRGGVPAFLYLPLPRPRGRAALRPCGPVQVPSGGVPVRFLIIGYQIACF